MYYGVPTSNPFSLLQEGQDVPVLSNLLFPGNSQSIVRNTDASSDTIKRPCSPANRPGVLCPQEKRRQPLKDAVTRCTNAFVRSSPTRPVHIENGQSMPPSELRKLGMVSDDDGHLVPHDAMPDAGTSNDSAMNGCDIPPGFQLVSHKRSQKRGIPIFFRPSHGGDLRRTNLSTL